MQRYQERNNSLAAAGGLDIIECNLCWAAKLPPTPVHPAITDRRPAKFLQPVLIRGLQPSLAPPDRSYLYEANLYINVAECRVICVFMQMSAGRVWPVCSGELCTLAGTRSRRCGGLLFRR